MTNQITPKQTIAIELVVRRNCFYSLRVTRELKRIAAAHPEIVLTITPFRSGNNGRQAFGGITPAVWVNDKLMFLGSFDAGQLLARLAIP